MKLKIKGKEETIRSIAKILREEGIDVVEVREEVEKKPSYFTPIKKANEEGKAKSEDEELKVW